MENDHRNVSSDLLIGAETISEAFFGGRLSRRQVYRLAEEGGWPIFRLRNKLACRRAAMREHMLRLEEAATGRSAS